MSISASDIIEIVRQAGVLTAIPSEKAGTSFKTLGIDSLDLYNILMQIEEHYQVKIPDADVEKLASVEAIVSYLNSRGEKSE